MYINTDFENPFLKIDEENNLLLPLNLFIDFSQSHIDVIPALRESTETLAGVDGEIVYGSTYSPRLFDLFCYTPSHLTAEQKALYKQHITYTLNQIKQFPKPLLWQGKIYMVKLTGTMQPMNFASFFNGPIQLKACDPSGYSQKVYLLKKSGVIRYSGNISVGVDIEIKGEAINPYVIINGHTIIYIGTISAGETLSINTQLQQAFLIKSDGTKIDVTGNVDGIKSKVLLKAATTQLINDIIEFEPYKNEITISIPDKTTIKWREKYL